MMYARNPLRPGMTAIAAVLALSSTQLFAQSADTSAASTTTPVLVTPPPVTVTPDAAAITSPPPSVTDAAPTTPTTTMQTTSTPVVHMPDSAVADSQDAAPAKTMRHAKAVSTTKAPIPAPVAAASVAPIPATAEKQSVASKTATTETSQVVPVAAAKTQPVTQTASNDDLLPIAGIAGVGLLALAGGFALARRRKPEEDVHEAAVLPETATAAPYEPVFLPEEPVYAMAEAPELIDAPRTEVPAGFDMSRFGRHTQAAYRGPTADNPSLSLKHRLKRASFFDQRERMAGITPAPQTEMPAPAIATTARRTEHADHIVSRLRPQKQPTFKPVFQN